MNLAILFLLGITISCHFTSYTMDLDRLSSSSASSPDVETQGAYRAASKLAKRGLKNDFFSCIKNHKLDLNYPFDTENNRTLMHSIASCPDTTFGPQMLDKAVKELNGDLYAKDAKGIRPIEIPLSMKNLYNSYNMLQYVSLGLSEESPFNLLIKLFKLEESKALLFKQEQDTLRQQITGMVRAQQGILRNKKQPINVLFNTESIAKNLNNNIFIYPKDFTKIPTIEAKKALLAHELEHFNKTIPFNNQWEYEYAADKAAYLKYPRGTIKLLEWAINYYGPTNNKASQSHPSTQDRLRRLQTYTQQIKSNLYKTQRESSKRIAKKALKKSLLTKRWPLISNNLSVG